MSEISDRVLDEQIEPQPCSGRQEMLENIVNRYI
jgi:xylose isomerase